MTATTATTATSATTRMRHGSVATALRGLLRGQLTIAGWALLVLVASAALTITVLAVVRPPDYSIVGFARQGVIWFPFSLAIAVAVGQPNVQVGMGRTRRAFGRAAVLAALAMSVVYAVGVVGLIELERALYAVVGWEHAILDDLGLVSDSTQIGALLAGYLVAAGSGQLCGLLCGLVYYRFGGWWGTLTLPLTVGPIILIQIVLSADLAFLGDGFALGTTSGNLARTGVVLVLLALVAVAFERIVRGTQIRTASIV